MEKSSPNGAPGNDNASPLSLPAHCLTVEAALRDLKTHPDDGLTAQDAKSRLETYGPNKLEEGEGVSVIKIIIRQVANAMMLVKRPISLFPFHPVILMRTLFV